MRMKPLPDSNPPSVEQAWREGDEEAMISAVVAKYARVLDMTDSGRDIKPLASGMFEAVDRLKALRESRAGDETVLGEVLQLVANG